MASMIRLLCLTFTVVYGIAIEGKIHKRRESETNDISNWLHTVLLPPMLPPIPDQGGKALHTFPLVNGCSCKYETYDCGCCEHLDIPKVHINDTGCVNITYLPDQYGLSLTFSLDGKVLFNETVSAKNPPPLCFGVPHLTAVSLCLRFYNMSLSHYTLSSCMKVEARLYGVSVEEINLGCFKLGPHYSRSGIKATGLNTVLKQSFPMAPGQKKGLKELQLLLATKYGATLPKTMAQK